MNKKIKVMNRKGVGPGIVGWELAYVVLAVLFLVGMVYFVSGYKDKATIWEDFYAKEIVKVVDLAEPGDEVYLDVTKATKLAKKSGKSFSEIFIFDNAVGKVTVSLRQNSGKSFNYFNNVTVFEPKIELNSGGAEVNRLHFFVK